MIHAGAVVITCLPRPARIGPKEGKCLMCDYVFLAHNVAREPGDPLAAKDARNCACAVVRLVETIRAYLPVEGRKRQKSWRVQERAGCTVCNLYLATEKVRNPNKYPFGAGRGTSDSFDYWPDGLHTPWVDLCDSLDTLAEFFGWQAVSLGEKLPGIPNVRAGGTIPPVPTDLLGDLQSAAETIMALTVDQPEGVKSETKIEGADPRDHEAEPAKPTGGNKRKPAATINERMAGTIMEIINLTISVS